MLARYHYQLPNFPSISWPDQLLLQPTRHALQAAQEDRYGSVELPRTIVPGRWLLVEVVMDTRRLVKAVLRGPSGVPDLDLVLVVAPTARDVARIVTCWLNECSDSHASLNPKLYHNGTFV